MNTMLHFAENSDAESALEVIRQASAVTLWTALAIWVAHLILWIVISKKAGYSGWWGFFGVIIPPLGLVFFVLFGLAKWPALSQRDAAIGTTGALEAPAS